MKIPMEGPFRYAGTHLLIKFSFLLNLSGFLLRSSWLDVHGVADPADPGLPLIKATGDECVDDGVPGNCYNQI